MNVSAIKIEYQNSLNGISSFAQFS